MIHLGADPATKLRTVAEHVALHEIRRVVVVEPANLPLFARPHNVESVGAPVDVYPWHEATFFRHFYPLVGRGDTEKKIDDRTLVVLNECLRAQGRHDLTYNCLANYLRLTPHRLTFQRLPIVDAVEDLAALVDFDTAGRFKREPYSPALLAEARWSALEVPLELRALAVETTPAERAAYAREKRRLIDGLGQGDPHTIPRNLHLLGGKAKARWVARWDARGERRYLGRNRRLGLAALDTYDTVDVERAPYTVLEFPHRFLDFSDALAATGQSRLDALVTDLKVDGWYFERFTAWAGRVREAHRAVAAATASTTGGSRAPALRP